MVKWGHVTAAGPDSGGFGVLKDNDSSSQGPFTSRRGTQVHVGGVTCGGSPQLSCERDQMKMRHLCTDGLPQLSGLPHLPWVPHLPVNRP